MRLEKYMFICAVCLGTTASSAGGTASSSFVRTRLRHLGFSKNSIQCPLLRPTRRRRCRPPSQLAARAAQGLGFYIGMFCLQLISAPQRTWRRPVRSSVMSAGHAAQAGVSCNQSELSFRWIPPGGGRYGLQSRSAGRGGPTAEWLCRPHPPGG